MDATGWSEREATDVLWDKQLPLNIKISFIKSLWDQRWCIVLSIKHKKDKIKMVVTKIRMLMWLR